MSAFLAVMGIVFIVLLFFGSFWLVYNKLVDHDGNHRQIEKRLMKLEGGEDKVSGDWY